MIVDLNQEKEIETIFIFGKMKLLPLISLSLDGNRWHNIPSIDVDRDRGNLLRIEVKKKGFVRFVRIKPLESELEIDEVEIY